MKVSKRNRSGELIAAEVTLRKSEIPEYLKQGELYRTLMENNDDPNEEVTFPADVLKPNTQIDCMSDCDYLLNSLRFWGVDGVGSKEIISYVLCRRDPHERCDAFLRKYETEFKFVFWLGQVILARQCDKCTIAIQSGLMELVEPVFESHVDQKQPLPADACDWAAKENNLEVMKFLHNIGCKFNHRTGKIAARNGYTSILQFLIDNGYEMGGDHLYQAVSRGHLECVQIICAVIVPEEKEMARDRDVSLLDSDVTDAAAVDGHLDCLQYAHEHGCTWTYEESEGTESVCFVMYGYIVVQYRMPYNSSLVWEYLRIHATNA